MRPTILHTCTKCCYLAGVTYIHKGDPQPTAKTGFLQIWVAIRIILCTVDFYDFLTKMRHFDYPVLKTRESPANFYRSLLAGQSFREVKCVSYPEIL
jgi:hypothetical protein